MDPRARNDDISLAAIDLWLGWLDSIEIECRDGFEGSDWWEIGSRVWIWPSDWWDSAAGVDFDGNRASDWWEI